MGVIFEARFRPQRILYFSRQPWPPGFLFIVEDRSWLSCSGSGGSASGSDLCRPLCRRPSPDLSRQIATLRNGSGILIVLTDHMCNVLSTLSSSSHFLLLLYFSMLHHCSIMIKP